MSIIIKCFLHVITTHSIIDLKTLFLVSVFIKSMSPINPYNHVSEWSPKYSRFGSVSQLFRRREDEEDGNDKNFQVISNRSHNSIHHRCATNGPLRSREEDHDDKYEGNL
ncbi:hypothetical protein VTN00DRAFT_5359 [Thermoascus crustaceus]|uniref:uncharacterized protein n=1 Tax=Thermoascus crustaceus TaxID=5088 RepID=UPI00374495AB